MRLGLKGSPFHRLLLPLDVHIGAGCQALAQEQVLLDAMPYGLVQLARREEVDQRAFLDGDICYDETGMVLRHVLVYDSRQQSKIAVEEEDDEEGEGSRGSDLSGCPDLEPHSRQMQNS